MVKYINSFLFALCVLLSFSACEREEDMTVATLTYKIDTIAPSYYYADIWCLISCNAPYKDVIVYYSTHSDFTDYKTQVTICDEHGYYKTWDEAFKAYEDYTKGWDSTQFKVDQCACGLYYFWVIK